MALCLAMSFTYGYLKEESRDTRGDGIYASFLRDI
jgi:hypothetical protein